MKKRYYYLIGLVFLLVIFFASPYILDVLQWKSALKAAGGIPVYEGIKTHSTIKCIPSCPNPSGVPTCCIGQTPLCSLSIPPACIDFDMVVAVSAGGMPCPGGYLLNPMQASMVQGSSNIILGGTTCNTMSLIATEKGCLGCTAAINSPNVYAYKNKIKSFINDYIIAIFKD